MAGDIILTRCGLICEDCEYYKGEKAPKCTGCATHRGKPFWGDCPTFTCVEEHGIEHCGLCVEFPCDRFIDMFDPSQGQVSSVIRTGLLAYRRKHGDRKSVELARKIRH